MATNASVVLILIIYAFIFGFLGIIYLAALIDYIVGSLALHRIATRRKIEKAWLIWIPIAGFWTLGELLDEIEGRQGSQKNWKKALLWLAVIARGVTIVSVVGFYLGYFVLAAGAVSGGMMGEGTIIAICAIILCMAFYVMIFISSFLSMATNICKAVAMYKIFESLVPEKTVKYFLLYLLTPVIGSFCLYKSKELGYPEPEVSEPEDIVVSTEE